ncbi:MAG: AEC family transporter [Clostridiales bacterium]|nr:AEC family transporter [Clostridiales bacterium]
MDLSALLTKMVIFVVLMVIGYIGARTKLLNGEFTKAASKLTLNVFMSATILNSVIANPPELSGGELAEVMLACFVSIGLGYLLSALIVRLLPFNRERKPLMELLISVTNTMFIGVPVAEPVFGSQAVFYIAMSCIPFNVLLYTYGVWRMNQSGERVKLHLKDMVSVPLIATLAALLIFVVKIPMPTVVKELCSTLSAATMPMSMLVIGSSLGRVSLLDAFKEKSLYFVSLVRLVLVPLLTLPVLRLITADPVLLGAMVIIAGCPSGIVVTVLAIQYGRDAEYTSKGILLNTVLSMVTLPALVYLLL